MGYTLGRTLSSPVASDFSLTKSPFWCYLLVPWWISFQGSLYDTLLLVAIRYRGQVALPPSLCLRTTSLLFLMSLGLFLGRSEKPMWLEDVVRAYSAVGGREAFLYVVSLVETMF